MATPSESLSRRLRWARLLTHLTWFGLLLSFTLWQFTRPQGPSWFFWLVQCVPLLLFAPGLYKRLPRTYTYLCFVMLIYFVKAVDGLALPNRSWIDYAMLIASIVLFISAMFTSRWQFQLAQMQSSSPAN